MRMFPGIVMISSLVLLFDVPPALAQARVPGPNTVAVGAGVGFLAPDTTEEESARVLETATATFDGFVDYHYNTHVSIRGSYGWAQPAFEDGGDRALRRQHVTASVAYGWLLGAFRPYASLGGGAYFLSRRHGDARVGGDVTKSGGILGWGLEYYLRTFALRTEMNVHILTEDDKLPELGTRTATAFTWVFGVKVPF
jgi:hypothetical protein